jgi:hypothetical protein
MEMFAHPPFTLSTPSIGALSPPLPPSLARLMRYLDTCTQSIAPLFFSLVVIIPKAQVLVSLHFSSTKSILLQLAASLPSYFCQSVVLKKSWLGPSSSVLTSLWLRRWWVLQYVSTGDSDSVPQSGCREHRDRYHRVTADREN